MARELDPSRPIHGHFAKAIIDGTVLGEADGYEWEIENQKQEVSAFGMEYIGHKAGLKKITGKVTGFVTDSSFLKRGFKRFNLLCTLEDPEAYGFERVMLLNCMMDKIGRSVQDGELVKFDATFTADGYKSLDYIEQ